MPQIYIPRKSEREKIHKYTESTSNWNGGENL